MGERPPDEEDEFVFTGEISGWGNTIPGPGEEDGNREGSVCPEEYLFLTQETPG